MAWTSPLTAVANTALTAAQWNATVRDNLNETAPAKATTAGRIFVATGVNAIAERAIETARVDTSETTSSTSYTALATPGPAVTVTTGAAALVILTGQVSNNTAASYARMSYAVSGATVVASADNRAVTNRNAGVNNEIRMSAVTHHTGLTPGSNTFTAQYSVSANVGTFAYRTITVIGL